jgi:tRNA-Thr(GGU) m(6)t(6)A37 methyltransferase TsaA
LKNRLPVKEVTYKPIGIIHTKIVYKEDVPIQSIFAKNLKGTVEVFPQYTAGLKDIKGFSHLFLLYHFHLSDGYSLTAKPFLDNVKRGIFSIRHFRRPNPIGISLVRLDKVRGNILEVSGVDIVDGTPLLDIKPYIPKFDSRVNAKTGWYARRSKK